MVKTIAETLSSRLSLDKGYRWSCILIKVIILISRLFKEILGFLGIRKTRIMALHPQSDG